MVGKRSFPIGKLTFFGGEGGSHLVPFLNETRKTPYYFPLSWLFNRNPYNGLLLRFTTFHSCLWLDPLYLEVVQFFAFDGGQCHLQWCDLNTQ